MSQIVVFGVFFRSIVDHVKMTEGILRASQGDARRYGVLVSSKVSLLEVEILEVLIYIIVDQCIQIYRVWVVVLLVQ